MMAVDKDYSNAQGIDGKFLPGNPGGPGRPVGSLDLMSICRRKAKASGVELEKLVWAAIKGLALRAAQGNALAAKVLLDRLCGVVEKPSAVAAVQVNVNGGAQENTGNGPPMPTGGMLGEYIKRLVEVADQQGIVKLDGLEVIERAAEELSDQGDVEELLS